MSNFAGGQTKGSHVSMEKAIIEPKLKGEEIVATKASG